MKNDLDICARLFQDQESYFPWVFMDTDGVQAFPSRSAWKTNVSSIANDLLFLFFI